METGRLRIIPLAEVHRSDFVALVSDPEVVHWCFDVPPEEQISEQFDARIGKLNGAGAEWNSYAVLDQEDGSFIGITGYAMPRSEVGFLFSRNSHGKGFATESLKLLQRVAKSNGLTSLKAYVTEGNLALCRVLEKCSFVHVATMENAITIGSKTYNDLVFKWKVDGNAQQSQET